VYNDWVINRDEMKEVGDDLVYVIDSLGYEDKVSHSKEHEISVVGREMY
jgi:hypothetical protein